MANGNVQNLKQPLLAKIIANNNNNNTINNDESIGSDFAQQLFGELKAMPKVEQVNESSLNFDFNFCVEI